MADLPSPPQAPRTLLWPLFDLRLRTARLELRLPTEDELFALAASAPDDLETDPSWPAPPGVARPAATNVLQWYWRALGGWRVQEWRLPLAVWADERLVGFQELEATRFDPLRTVETSSWLAPDARGKGIGKEMRAAVLALAFDHLGAEVATSGAWESNGASLGVSRALGYVDNGWGMHQHHDTVAVMRRVLLARADWHRDRWPTTVTGLDGCRSWFGA